MIINLSINGAGSSGSGITNETDPVWNEAKTNVVTISNTQIADANEFKTNGWAQTTLAHTEGDVEYTDTANLPTGAAHYGIIQYIKKSSTSGLQIYIPTAGTNIGRIYTRRLGSNVWSAWKSYTFADDVYSKSEIDTMVGNVETQLASI